MKPVPVKMQQPPSATRFHVLAHRSKDPSAAIGRPSFRIRRQYFILIAADADRNRLSFPSAYTLAKYRLQRGEWGLANRTRYRTQLRPGDRVLIYISGHREFAQHVVASAEISDFPAPALPSDIGLLDSPDKQAMVLSPYKVGLTNIVVMPQPLCLRPLIPKLTFIKSEYRKLWRIYFQGGVVKIPFPDFRFLIQAGNAQPKASIT